jgi:hypothetical protein
MADDAVKAVADCMAKGGAFANLTCQECKGPIFPREVLQKVPERTPLFPASNCLHTNAAVCL